jgi:hypothetical protein
MGLPRVQKYHFALYETSTTKPGFHHVALNLFVLSSPVNNQWVSQLQVSHGEVLFGGVVTDNEGDPVPNEPIRIFEKNFLFGGEEMGMSYTDDTGNFRFTWIADYSEVDGDGNAEFFAQHDASEHYGRQTTKRDVLRKSKLTDSDYEIPF